MTNLDMLMFHVEQSIQEMSEADQGRVAAFRANIDTACKDGGEHFRLAVALVFYNTVVKTL